MSANNTSTDSTNKSTTPKLVIRGDTSVSVESLSWMEIIKRKHGLGTQAIDNKLL